MLVCIFCFSGTLSSTIHSPHPSGHPVSRPEFVNQKPQVGGKRAGLLSAFPRTVQQETFLRGAWPTDRNGIAQFTSACLFSFLLCLSSLSDLIDRSNCPARSFSLCTAIFPGYYTGRATHVHTKVYPTWKTLPNGSFTSDQLAHVGQFFFEDEVNLRIDSVRIYFIQSMSISISLL
jgi:hypothetical protein